MKALVLKEKGKLAIIDMAFDEKTGPDDVRIKMHTVGSVEATCIIILTAK